MYFFFHFIQSFFFLKFRGFFFRSQLRESKKMSWQHCHRSRGIFSTQLFCQLSLIALYETAQRSIPYLWRITGDNYSLFQRVECLVLK